jgi:hypothetical protein
MTIEDIEKGIAKLPSDQLAEFRAWFEELLRLASIRRSGATPTLASSTGWPNKPSMITAKAVMPGLVPGIPIELATPCEIERDGRDKPGRDGLVVVVKSQSGEARRAAPQRPQYGWRSSLSIQALNDFIVVSRSKFSVTAMCRSVQGFLKSSYWKASSKPIALVSLRLLPKNTRSMRDQ